MQCFYIDCGVTVSVHQERSIRKGAVNKRYVYQESPNMLSSVVIKNVEASHHLYGHHLVYIAKERQ